MYQSEKIDFFDTGCQNKVYIRKAFQIIHWFLLSIRVPKKYVCSKFLLSVFFSHFHLMKCHTLQLNHCHLLKKKKTIQLLQNFQSSECISMTTWCNLLYNISINFCPFVCLVDLRKTSPVLLTCFCPLWNDAVFVRNMQLLDEQQSRVWAHENFAKYFQPLKMSM